MSFSVAGLAPHIGILDRETEHLRVLQAENTITALSQNAAELKHQYRVLELIDAVRVLEAHNNELLQDFAAMQLSTRALMLSTPSLSPFSPVYSGGFAAPLPAAALTLEEEERLRVNLARAKRLSELVTGAKVALFNAQRAAEQEQQRKLMLQADEAEQEQKRRHTLQAEQRAAQIDAERALRKETEANKSAELFARERAIEAQKAEVDLKLRQLTEVEQQQQQRQAGQNTMLRRETSNNNHTGGNVFRQPHHQPPPPPPPPMGASPILLSSSDQTGGNGDAASWRTVRHEVITSSTNNNRSIGYLVPQDQEYVDVHPPPPPPPPPPPTLLMATQQSTSPPRSWNTARAVIAAAAAPSTTTTPAAALPLPPSPYATSVHNNTRSGPLLRATSPSRDDILTAVRMPPASRPRMSDMYSNNNNTNSANPTTDNRGAAFADARQQALALEEKRRQSDAMLYPNQSRESQELLDRSLASLRSFSANNNNSSSNPPSGHLSSLEGRWRNADPPRPEILSPARHLAPINREVDDPYAQFLSLRPKMLSYYATDPVRDAALATVTRATVDRVFEEELRLRERRMRNNAVELFAHAAGRQCDEEEGEQQQQQQQQQQRQHFSEEEERSMQEMRKLALASERRDFMNTFASPTASNHSRAAALLRSSRGMGATDADHVAAQQVLDRDMVNLQERLAVVPYISGNSNNSAASLNATPVSFSSSSRPNDFDRRRPDDFDLALQRRYMEQQQLQQRPHHLRSSYIHRASPSAGLTEYYEAPPPPPSGEQMRKLQLQQPQQPQEYALGYGYNNRQQQQEEEEEEFQRACRQRNAEADFEKMQHQQQQRRTPLPGNKRRTLRQVEAVSGVPQSSIRAANPALRHYDEDEIVPDGINILVPVLDKAAPLSFSDARRAMVTSDLNGTLPGHDARFVADYEQIGDGRHSHRPLTPLRPGTAVAAANEPARRPPVEINNQVAAAPPGNGGNWITTTGRENARDICARFALPYSIFRLWNRAADRYAPTQPLPAGMTVKVDSK